MINYSSWTKELADYSGWLQDEQPSQPEPGVKAEILDVALSIKNVNDTVMELTERFNDCYLGDSLEDVVESLDLCLLDNCQDIITLSDRIEVMESRLSAIELNNAKEFAEIKRVINLNMGNHSKRLSRLEDAAFLNSTAL